MIPVVQPTMTIAAPSVTTRKETLEVKSPEVPPEESLDEGDLYDTPEEFYDGEQDDPDQTASKEKKGLLDRFRRKKDK